MGQYLIPGEPLIPPEPGMHIHDMGYWAYSDGSRYRMSDETAARLQRYGEGKSLSKELQVAGKM